MTSPLSMIPAVDRVLAQPAVQALSSRCDPAMVTRVVRAAVEALRQDILQGEFAYADRKILLQRVVQDVISGLREALLPSLRPVINATGVILHTNLGRAPLSRPACRKMAELAAGYSNLEIDLETGRRGLRHQLVEGLLCDLTGAEAAAVVNNNAAAVLLTLNTLSPGPGGGGLTWPADRDWRVVPDPGNHGAKRRDHGGSGHHQPYPSAGL